MGLDFYVERRNVNGENMWEEVWYGRNCHAVREAMFSYLRVPVSEEYVYFKEKDLFYMVKNLAENLEIEDMYQDSFFDRWKAYDAISSLSVMCKEILWEYEVSEDLDEEPSPQFEYRIINSY